MTTSGAENPVVAVRSLTRHLAGRAVLDAVDLDLWPGTVTMLTGRSGSGKTTLLRLIAGLDAADAGEIRIVGRLASGPAPLIPPHRRGVGMVFQQPALWPHMTVADHLQFALGDRPTPAAAARAQEVMALVGIAGLSGKRPAELSGGEAARAALARAIAPAPTCLLMDEPLAHLDSALRHEIAALLGRVTATTRAATLIVTHMPEDLAGIADRALHLADGHLRDAGPPPR